MVIVIDIQKRLFCQISRSKRLFNIKWTKINQSPLSLYMTPKNGHKWQITFRVKNHHL